ncbi:MobF family relaxase [Rhodococcus sp. IEGM 1372]|uniref:MobF family relaxase n=1 Tax=unclassified Rhodococcus (in: high G+C Gram-positive bacteria) TaxID=192944 RepID=UPI001FB4FA5C|nr:MULTISPECIES: MobF family relaxase [unclassified Rhodococcus (in: high G+C Gram-positive bacteria)]MCJ0980619.1 relaxase domain-containing protein [Rhodococcus sp. ARC_M12]MDI9924149.1 MobF family relaxase [Rhodococcus sp. IEGM 1372]
MGLHKLTAGDGYEYLTRQVAAADSTERGASSLADYYSEKGESPGRWAGAGLAGLGSVAAGQQVSEAQMKALFGEGLHPNADLMFELALAQGASQADAARSAKLGRAFKIDSGATAYRVACAEAFVAHNLARGQKWNAAIDDADRARIRTDVGSKMFAKEYGRAPADERELSGWVAKVGRQKSSAVAGFDLTFTPVKSVSALWAVAPREVAEQIEAAHESAIAAAVTYLEKHACFTRVGTGGVAQVDGNGLIAAQFTHRDSRAGDPNLHTHVAISNKVAATMPDGTTKWLALDGAALYRNNVPASEVYNTVLEAQLRERVGVRFTERASTDRSKRRVREIDGMDERLAERWSSRSAAIRLRTAELARAFQADHGREPTAIEAISLAQQATLETRAAKHEPVSHADQRSGWRAEAIEILGSQKALSELVSSITAHTAAEARTDFDHAWVRETAERSLDIVSRKRSRFLRHNIRAEVVRQVRTFDPPAERIDALVDAVTDLACGDELSIDLSGAADTDPAADIAPDVMRRRDGADVHTRHESQLLTTAAVLDAEARIVALAGRTDGIAIDDKHVEIALLESAANGLDLNAGQRSLVRAMATSGAKVQLALAPAGTGKTASMKALTTAWQNAAGRVVGFAPTAAAAAVLRQDILTTTDTLAKFVDITQRLREGRSVKVPQWYTDIGEDTLVIVDEAGMTGTLDLDEAITALVERGATVRLIGDDQQLASVASGGVLRDIHDRIGALSLSQVVRFRDPAEGAASLALRDGDEAAIGFYIDHGRVHVGSIATVTDDAYTAWAADHAAGKDALMLAPTRELVAELNTRARSDRLAATDTRVGREAVLADGLVASAGDTVRTRSNDRRNPLSQTDWVRNGDRWIVEKVGRDGSLRVRHIELGRTVTLDADYVQSATELGYAGTVHSAQGSTADTCHVVATGDETRQLAYVGLTRGKQANHLYLATASDGDMHTAMTERGMLPPTAVDDLREILRRDGAQVSAHSTLAEADDPHLNLSPAARAYDYSVATGSEVHLGPEVMAAIDVAAEEEAPGLTDEPAWPTLRGHLAILGAHGRDPVEALRSAVRSRELDTALDRAAVLDWRLDPSGKHSSASGPLPWLPAIPTAVHDLPEWGAYLDAREELVTAHCARIAVDVATWTPTTAPVWARPLLTDEPDLELLTDLAVFRAAHDVDPADRRPTGPEQLAAASVKAQRSLDRRAAEMIDTGNDAVARWRPFVDELDTHIARDPYFPMLADRLSAAARAGIEVHTLVRDSLATSPLPDELPAAALWWRLSGELSVAALDADTDGAVLEPSWTPVLTELLGYTAAVRVMSDAAWPSLVATVDDADPTLWTPGQLLGTAYEFLHGGIDPVDHGVTLPAHELATALTWRAEMLVRENHLARTYTPPIAEPLSIEDEEAVPVVDEAVSDTIGGELPDEFVIPAPLPTEAAATDTVVDGSTPAIPVDADYLASLDALDAPVDYDQPPPPEYDSDYDQPPPEYDSGYEDEYTGVDHEAGAPLDIAADTAEAATPDADVWDALRSQIETIELPYPTVTTDERVRLLTADLDDAKAKYRELRGQLSDGTSPAQFHARTMLAELQERADRQRPARIAMLDTRQEWTDREFEAEALWHHIDTVIRPAVAADVAAAGDDDDARALAQRGLDWEIWRAGFVDDTATAARTRAHEAAAEYERVTAADGGEVTAVDVTTARLAAESIDLATLAELKADVDRTEAMLWRAEQAAQRAAMTDTLTLTPHVQPSVEAVDAPAADAVEQLEQTAPTELAVEDATEPAPEPQPVLSLADATLLAKMERDPIRLVPDAELAAFVDRAGRDRTEPTVVPDTEKLYARLDEQAAAIAAAREIETELRRVTAQYEAARTEHATLTEQLSTAKRRERKSIEPAVDDARLREERLARQTRDTQRAARDASGRVGAETGEWPAIVQRATDPDRRSADLSAATVFDTAITEHARRRRQKLTAPQRAAIEQRLRRETDVTPEAINDAPPVEGITDQRRDTEVLRDAERQDAARARSLASAPSASNRQPTTDAATRRQTPQDIDPNRGIDLDHGL